MANLKIRRIDPLKAGDVLVESSSSVLVRTAEANHVVVCDLVDFLKSACPDAERVSWPNSLALFDGLDGINPISHEIGSSEAMRHLLGDLRNHTFEPMSGLVSGRRIIRGYKAWCAQCLQHAYVNFRTVYEPLLWRVAEDRSCIVHQTELETQCPACGAGNLRILTATSRIGCCTKCGAWLGCAAHGKRASDSDYLRSIYVADLVASFQREPRCDIGSQEVLRRLRHHFFEDSTRLMSLGLGVDTNQIYTWLGGIAKPALAKWVDICSTVQILPRDLLQLEPFTPPEGRVRASQRRHEPTELGAKLQATLASQPNPSLWIACGRDTATYQTARRLFPNLVHQYSEKQRRYREDQMERCEKFLNMALASDDLIGASDVAKQTGVDVQTLRRFFPAKTVELGRLYVEKKKQLCLSRIESLRLKIRDGINRVDGAGLEISRQNIAVALGLQRHERLSGEMLELIREESYAHVAGDAVRRSNERFLRGKGYSRIVKDEG